MTKFTILELIQCARRELAMRRRVYRRWVADGKIKPEDAEREIALMAAILEFLEEHDQPKLF